MSDRATSDLLQQGFARHRAGQFEAAVQLYQRVLDAEPSHVDGLNLMASARRSLGQVEAAIALFARALSLAPLRADIWYNRANAEIEAELVGAAVQSYQQSLAIEPDNADVLANLGIACARLGDLAQAEQAYRAAVKHSPDHRIALHNLCNLLGDRGAHDEAVGYLRRVVKLYPDLATARYNLALLLLRLGDYAAGLELYESRWATPGFPSRLRHQSIPAWDGRPFDGKVLLVHAEQGLGDTIQFVQLLGLVQSLGGTVVLQVPDRLKGLMGRLRWGVAVIGDGDPLPLVDLQVPLLSLPHRLGLTASGPGIVEPWLAVDQTRVDVWRRRLGLDAGSPAVGLVWQGNRLSPVEQGRSLSGPEAFQPLSEIAGLRLICLQKLPFERLEPADCPSGWKVSGLPFVLEYPGPDFDDGDQAFLDSAAIMPSLSHVVSICSAPLHLAGGLSVPAIGLLKAVPDWRWGLQGETSPWYKQTRLCRQSVAGDFSGPVLAAAELIRASLKR